MSNLLPDNIQSLTPTTPSESIGDGTYNWLAVHATSGAFTGVSATHAVITNLTTTTTVNGPSGVFTGITSTHNQLTNANVTELNATNVRATSGIFSTGAEIAGNVVAVAYTETNAGGVAASGKIITHSLSTQQPIVMAWVGGSGLPLGSGDLAEHPIYTKELRIIDSDSFVWVPSSATTGSSTKITVIG